MIHDKQIGKPEDEMSHEEREAWLYQHDLVYRDWRDMMESEASSDRDEALASMIFSVYMLIGGVITTLLIGYAMGWRW